MFLTQITIHKIGRLLIEKAPSLGQLLLDILTHVGLTKSQYFVREQNTPAKSVFFSPNKGHQFSGSAPGG